MSATAAVSRDRRRGRSRSRRSRSRRRAPARCSSTSRPPGSATPTSRSTAAAFPTPFPVVLGHEGAGVVAAVGDGVTHVAAGRPRRAELRLVRVAARSCLVGRPYHCHEFFAHNFMACARRRQHRDLRRAARPCTRTSSGSRASRPRPSSRRAASSRCRPTSRSSSPRRSAAASRPARARCSTRCAPPAGSSLAVFGAGGVGLSARDGRAHRRRVADHRDRPAAGRACELARELGATETIDPRSEDVVEAIMRITGIGVDYAVEASGATVALRAAVDALGPGGTVRARRRPRRRGRGLARRQHGAGQGPHDPRDRRGPLRPGASSSRG